MKVIARTISGIGRAGIGFCVAVGDMALLLASAFTYLRPVGRRHLRFGASFRQMLRLGVRSIPLVAMVNFMVGAIVAVSLAELLRDFGVIEWISQVVGVATTRELGPLMTALMMSGFAGAAIAAEIGTMSVSDELIALRAQALPPIYFLVAPRLAAMMIMMPCLVVVANFMGIIGGFIISVFFLQIEPATYYSLTVETVTNRDVLSGVFIKAEVFAIIITVVACHLGLSTKSGAEGVGNATTGAVVQSIVFIISANLILSTLLHYTFA